MNCEFGKRSKAFKDNIKFIVDPDDYEKFVKNNSFHLDKGYVTNGKKKYLHRLIMNAPDDMVVDHINGDKLDNRKENLRICTNQQNQMNRGKTKNNKTGFKGVCFNKRDNKYQANIKVDGKKKHLGLFEKSEDAYKAYCDACVRYHGEFSNTG
jgi:hypothetical protein